MHTNRLGYGFEVYIYFFKALKSIKNDVKTKLKSTVTNDLRIFRNLSLVYFITIDFSIDSLHGWIVTVMRGC